jgi:hypothetical protein
MQSWKGSLMDARKDEKLESNVDGRAWQELGKSLDVEGCTHPSSTSEGKRLRVVLGNSQV